MNEYVTVSEVNAYINNKLKSDLNLHNIYLKGEISNYKTYPSGHSYFTLKDSKSQINAVMFQGYKRNLHFIPENGMKVVIHGKIEVYEVNGKYQLYAFRIIEDGVGELHIAYEQLKKKLKEEGLFDDSHKREIPKYPRKIGVITAKNGAAIKDIITTIKRRYPLCEVLVFSTLVQGKLASKNIVKQIKYAEHFNLDTLIIGRGGGSIEDLWPFNEENVARAIYECEIPTISAVGHEIDYTISDYVADLRAPTPTAAAELAVPNVIDIRNKLQQYNSRLIYTIKNKIIKNREQLENLSKKQILRNPHTIYDIKKMHLDTFIGRFSLVSNSIINKNKNKLFKLKNSTVLKNPDIIIKSKEEKYLHNLGKLEVLNPILTLKRGYTITKKDNKVISSINEIKVDDELEVEFNNGKINVKVI